MVHARHNDPARLHLLADVAIITSIAAQLGAVIVPLGIVALVCLILFT